ncbi:MAG: MBL fold metallo-hydrolase [Saprospiraceae bacterium]|nr:MBL fold metallo-hydrolase [Saprospiraceae bacterium]
MKKLLLWPLLAFGCAAQSQQNMNDVALTVTPLTEHMHMLEGRGGNIGIFTGEDGIIIIDSQFAPLSERIQAEVQKLSDAPINYLVNTHFHGDHTGGNAHFGSTGVTIVAHDNVRKRLSENEKTASRTDAFPTITYEQGVQLHINGQSVIIMHVHNAHTDSDSFIYFPEENVLHMGDVFFNKRFPYIDLKSGGSIDGYQEAVKAALMLVNEETQIIPGHGPLASKADLIAYSEMLSVIDERMRQALQEGKSLDQIKKEKLVGDLSDWNWGFINEDKIIETFYNGLSAND